jgi:DNA-binding response OmpR family regulator
MSNFKKQDKLRILVVEDTPGDIFLIKFYLEELDPDFYEIDSVHNLAEAHKKLSYDNFDVVLLDFHLPDSEGMVTLTSSVEKFPNQIFIVLTGLSDEKIGYEAIKNGAHDYLVKGRIDSKTLDSSIKYAVERNRIKTKIYQYWESVLLTEKLHNDVSFIVNLKNGFLDYSQLFLSYIGETEKIDSIDKFASKLNCTEEFLAKVKGLNEDDIAEMSVKLNDQHFILKFNIGKRNNILACCLKKV